MGIGESIKKGFGAAKKSMNLVLVLFIFGTIFSLINVFLAPAEGADPNTPPPPALVVSGIVFIFLSIYFQAGAMGFVRNLIKAGSAKLDSFTSSGRKYYLRLLALGVVVTAAFMHFYLALPERNNT